MAWLGKESCGGLAHPACGSGLDGGLFALRAPFHRQKENQQVSSNTLKRTLALLAVARRGGRGWKHRGGAKMAGRVIHPARAGAPAGSKAKYLALAASGRGLAQQRKLWRAWAADRDLEGPGDASRSGAGGDGVGLVGGDGRRMAHPAGERGIAGLRAGAVG